MKFNLIAMAMVFLIASTTVFARRERGENDNRNRERARSERRAQANNTHRAPRREHINNNRNSNRNNNRIRHNRGINRSPAIPTARADRRIARRVTRQYRAQRNYYGTQRYFAPYRYRQIPYRSYRHAPVNRIFAHRLNYTPFKYYNYLQNNVRNAVYINWLLFSTTYNNGYRVINNYPYFVYNGYRHRYSSTDTCNYQLFDKYTHQVIQKYWGYTCNTGYNLCASQRVSANARTLSNRYNCAETFRNRNFDFNTPTYNYEQQDEQEYGDSFQYDNNSSEYYDDQFEYDYDDNYGENENSCLDFDYELSLCLDNY